QKDEQKDSSQVGETKTEKYTFVITPDSISITLVSDNDYDTIVISDDNEKFEEAYSLIMKDAKCQFNLQEAYKLINVKYSIENYTNRKVSVLTDENRVIYKDDNGNEISQFSGK